MKKIKPLKFILTVIFVFLYSSQSYASCDRECLRDHISTYLNAMVANDASVLPLDERVRFTEDTEELSVEQGFWQTASGFTRYRQDFLDVQGGIAGTHVVMMEGEKPVLFVLRLKVENDLIAEIETQVTRSAQEGLAFSLELLSSPHPAMIHVPSQQKMHSRDELIQIADLYPLGLKLGSFEKSDVPFASSAYRLENGVNVAGPDCMRNEGCQNILTQYFPTISNITQRLIAVDEEQGIVWYRLDFGRDLGGRSLVVWEAFKVYDNQIHAVEAFMKTVPFGTPSGWEEGVVPSR